MSVIELINVGVTVIIAVASATWILGNTLNKHNKDVLDVFRESTKASMELRQEFSDKFMILTQKLTEAISHSVTHETCHNHRKDCPCVKSIEKLEMEFNSCKCCGGDHEKH